MGELVRCEGCGGCEPSADAPGAQVSTSNCVVADEVRIDTDAPLVWTTQLHFAADAELDARRGTTDTR